MHSNSAIFAVSAILLVPFIYATSSIPDVCAVLKDPNWGKSGICGYTDDTEKRMICCWEVGEPPNTVKSCQVCDADSSSDGNCEPVYLEKPSTGTIDPSPGGGVLQDPSDTTDKPFGSLGGGVLQGPSKDSGPKLLEKGGFSLGPNITFSQTNITGSNDSSTPTLQQLEEEAKKTENKTTVEGEEEEQDESDE